MDKNKIYTCVCGKTFTKPNSFNGHKSHCKKNFEAKNKLDKFNERIEATRIASEIGRNAIKEKWDNKKNEELDLWIKEGHTCERCGRVMDKKYASGRFCCRACANSREHSDATKEKIRGSVKSHFEYVEYNGSMVTRYKRSKLSNATIKKKHNMEALDSKHSKLYEELDMGNSPYSEYNRIYMNQGSGDCYMFVLTDTYNNKVIKRTLVPYYRYMVEKELGRILEYDEVVHHIDGNHNNNVLSNLKVMTRSEHSKLHNSVQ